MSRARSGVPSLCWLDNVTNEFQYLDVLFWLVRASVKANFMLNNTEAFDLVRIVLGDLPIDDRLEVEPLLLDD